MWWLSGPIIFLFSVGRTATGELFEFDLSPLRPGELCGPSGIRYKPDPQGISFTTIEFCPVQNHINLFGADTPRFVQRIEQIRNTSANRSVSLQFLKRHTLLNASILAPIGKQIVALRIDHNSQHDLTSAFPAIGLVNLLDLRFWNCLWGLRINKADFSGMHNIRAIEFTGSTPELLEEGTFTNLPTLQTLALGNDFFSGGATGPTGAYKQLRCDAKNAWLWEFLKGKPGLLKSRLTGDIFTLGNFTSMLIKVDQPVVKCE